MKTQLKEEMDNLLREHMSQTEQLQVDFNTSTQLLEEKYKQLEERYQEISELYDDRPSRTEDLEIIKALKKENRFAIASAFTWAFSHSCSRSSLVKLFG